MLTVSGWVIWLLKFEVKKGAFLAERPYHKVYRTAHPGGRVFALQQRGLQFEPRRGQTKFHSKMGPVKWEVKKAYAGMHLICTQFYAGILLLIRIMTPTMFM